jgi:hypothetical protein
MHTIKKLFLLIPMLLPAAAQAPVDSGTISLPAVTVKARTCSPTYLTTAKVAKNRDWCSPKDWHAGKCTQKDTYIIPTPATVAGMQVYTGVDDGHARFTLCNRTGTDIAAPQTTISWKAVPQQ